MLYVWFELKMSCFEALWALLLSKYDFCFCRRALYDLLAGDTNSTILMHITYCRRCIWAGLECLARPGQASRFLVCWLTSTFVFHRTRWSCGCQATLCVTLLRTCLTCSLVRACYQTWATLCRLNLVITSTLTERTVARVAVVWLCARLADSRLCVLWCVVWRYFVLLPVPDVVDKAPYDISVAFHYEIIRPQISSVHFRELSQVAKHFCKVSDNSRNVISDCAAHRLKLASDRSACWPDQRIWRRCDRTVETLRLKLLAVWWDWSVRATWAVCA